jgi:hypothetical protein
VPIFCVIVSELFYLDGEHLGIPTDPEFCAAGASSEQAAPMIGSDTWTLSDDAGK